MIKLSIDGTGEPFNYPSMRLFHYAGSAELYFYDGTTQSHSADVNLAPFPRRPAFEQRGFLRFRCPDRSKTMGASGRRPRSKEPPWRSQEPRYAHRVEKQRNSPYISEKKKVFRVIRTLLPPRRARRGRSAFLKRSIRVFGSTRCRTRLPAHDINIYRLKSTYADCV